MNNDLIKRYIYAVTCHLPVKSQSEVEKELESVIAELLDARCGDMEPTENDIKAILMELGSPEELAVKYSGDENKAIISGIYLLWFKKVLKIALPIAAAAVGFVTLVSGLIKWEPQHQAMYELIPETIAEAIAGATGAALQSILWIGLVFALLEHKKVDFSDGEFISKLQPVPDKRAQIKLHEPIMNILWVVAAAVFLLGFPHLIGGYWEVSGWTPVFNEYHIRSLWYLVVLWTIFGIVREAVKLTERRYSKRLALVTAVTHTFSGLFAFMFLRDDSILNYSFIKNICITLGDEIIPGKWILLGHINLLILLLVILSLILDICVTTYRAFKYS